MAAADILRCLPLNFNLTKQFSNKNEKLTWLRSIDLALYFIGRPVTGTMVFDGMEARSRSSFGVWVYGACNTGGHVFGVGMHVWTAIYIFCAKQKTKPGSVARAQKN